jgi:putative transposase
MEEIAQFAGAAQEEIRQDVGWLFRGAIRVMLECLLEQEVKEMVGARRYERLGSRKDHLNGTYLRRLLTSMGSIELAVPRTRQNGSPSGVVGRYKRRTEDMDRLVTTAYVQGVSTRDMTKLSEALMGEGVSRSTVSRVTKVLEEQVDALRRAPIDEPVPYLYLDATFLDARWARSVENVSALVAYGVDTSGHRRLLGISIGTEESEQSWWARCASVASAGSSS